MTQANLTSVAAQVFHEEVSFKPLGKRVVCVTEEAELEKHSSGLFLPAKDRERPLLARAVAVGKDVEEIEAGDLVLYERFAGAAIKSTDKPAILILEEGDIMATVKKGKTEGCWVCKK